MKAIRMARFGGPDVLSLEDVPEPAPADGEAIVELRAAGLNWHDVLVRQGLYGSPLPHTPGADGAGVRADTGEPVIILPSLHWGSDDRAPGPQFEILGDLGPGTYAQRVAVPQRNLFAMPAEWTFPEAAAFGLAGLTAYRALFTRGALAADETVLILGAGSGVSTLAVSLAVMAGARVLVTSSSSAKVARAVELGADDGVLYSDADWPAQVRDLTKGQGVDLVIDSAGTWPASLNTLRPGGRLVSFGATASSQADVAIRPFYFGQHTILGTTMGSPRDFTGLLQLISRHPHWRPCVDQVVPLAQAAELHAAMERREHFGKLVLTMEDAK